jgi:hypothetical protein
MKYLWTDFKITEKLNIDPSRIIFTSNYTSTEDLRYAFDMGVIINLDDYSLINIENICNFTKMRCDIYIDKIWKWNDVFTCKWKVKVIHLV